MNEVIRDLFAPWWQHVVYVITFTVVVLVSATPTALGAVRGIQRFASRPFAAEGVVFLVALILGVIPPLLGWRKPPTFHDEFAYLFQAETFAHGRLANDTPHDADHFQTFHLMIRPSFASKFPPGQAISMAVGMMLGSPRVGTIGAVAVACAATCWAARAVLPARWALLAGLLAAVEPLVLSWGQTFWGGGVAMIGGAIFCGAIFRLERTTDQRIALHGALVAAGLAILANSRPFEGVLLALPVGTWLIVRLARSGRLRTVTSRAAPAAAAVLVPVFAWMGYYNYRVTGSPLRLPYAVHSKQYMVAPLFWWQGENEPTAPLIPAHLRSFHVGHERIEYDAQHTLGGFLAAAGMKLYRLVHDYLWGVLPALPLVLGAVTMLKGGPLVPRHWRRTALLAVGTIAFMIVAHFCCTPWLRMQYFAPAAPLLFVLLATCTAAVSRWRVLGGRPIAGALALAALLTWGSVALARARLDAERAAGEPELARAKLIEQIERVPGNHLMFVYYADGTQQLYEWVHNPPDIDSQRVVWAHLLNPERNTALMSHELDRSVWLLVVNNRNVEFKPLVMRNAAMTTRPAGR